MRKEIKKRTPQWVDELKSKYYSGMSNFFILTGNVMDYAVPGILFENYLVEVLNEVLRVDRVSFLSPIATRKKNEIQTVDQAISVLTTPKFRNAIIVKYPEYLFPNSPDSSQNNLSFLELYDTLFAKDFMTSDNILIFIAESKFSINPKFFGGTTRSTLIEIEFPNEAERYDMIEYLWSGINIPSELTSDDFARVTAGLTRIGIEDIVLQAKQAGKLKRNFIIDRKTELIKKEYGEVIEVLSSDNYSFDDYAGQDHLKDYHMDAIVNPMKRGNLEIVPKGLLYTGPPGTGKTHFARCLAGEAGINFVELKVSKIVDKWVGESEKRFDKALACIRSITPVGVFIDEIDQAFSRGSTDGSGGSRVQGSLFSMLLTVLSEPENRGKILWIGATNYPNKIDEALKRTGRLDKKMPFLPPESSDRAKVLEIYLNKAKLPNETMREDLDKVVEATGGYTQAELEGIVVKSIELAMRRQARSIEGKDLGKALEYTKKADNKRIAEMTTLAIDECNDLEFLPKKYRK